MIKREGYLNEIRPFYNKNIIKIITGIRRSGKSTLIHQIIEDFLSHGVKQENIIHLNLDDYGNKDLLNKDDLYNYINKRISNEERTYIFIDEIQEVDEFEIIMNTLLLNKKLDIYITGSNSKMLASEFATYLTGRYVTISVYPFSFSEIADAYPDIDKQELFLDYVDFGGFPQLIAFEDARSKKNLLKDLYNSIVIKDLTDRYNIRDTSMFNKFLIYLVNTIGSLFSAKSINDYIKSEGRSISRDTIYNYLKYAKEAYFIYSVERYDIKGKKLLTTNEKIYVNDQGFRGLFFNNGKDIEKVLENIVYFELLRRGYNVYVGNIDGKEVDFIATKGEDRIYIQVTYILASEETIEREFGSLLAIEDQYPKYVISTEKFNRSREGIKHINIVDFLLKK